MKKIQRLGCLLLCLLMVVGMIPAVTVSAAAPTNYTLSAAASQVRRMWCQQSYNTNDYVYGNVPIFWGRVMYVRFLDTNDLDTDVKKAVLKFDARCRSAEKTIRVAALALSDAQAQATAENNLQSATQTLKYYYPTATEGMGSAATKLMLDKSGNYLSAVSGSVVAYGEFTASDTPTTEDTYQLEKQNQLFEYPVTVELDVTNAVRSARAAGKKNVQFVIMLPKDVYVNGSVNLGDLSDFGGYANGVVYDADGEVLYENVGNASLDTSGPVCGNAGYYVPDSKADDDYFYWAYPVQDTLELEITTITPEEAFAELKANVTSADKLPAALEPIKFMFEQWEQYESLQEDAALNATLYQKLQQADSMADFVTDFDGAVEQAYWQGYSLRLNVDTSFGGAKGTLTVEGKGEIPELCYAQLTASNGSVVKFTEAIVVKNGKAQYNVYDQLAQINALSLTLTVDKEGAEPLAANVTVAVTKPELPGVFISELSNQHTITYYPDTSAQNSGVHEQTFQYVELYNYSDKTVDLSEHTFEYTDHVGTHKFNWLLEDGGSLLLKPGEIYLIGVYGADSAAKGYTYATSDGRATYWKAFNSFYNCNVPVTNRVMIACVASGDGATMLDGVNKLTRSADAKVTCYARIKKGDTVVTEVSLAETRPGRSYAFQFLPSDTGAVREDFLFITGCYPGELLLEQDISYCEENYLNGTPMLKVMSYNILATEKSAGDNYTNLEIEQREDLFVEVMKDYDVDIVGMQEVNYRWAPLLKADMPKIGYSEVQGLSTKGHTYANASGTWDLMNPIYYKTAKFDLLESGAAFLNPDGKQGTKQWDSVNMQRTVTWAVLKNKDTGEVVSFLNTHLILSGKQGRVEQVKKMYNKGAELRAKYGGSIIITGDHNMVENSEPYQAYINGGVVVDSKYQTTNKVSISTCSNGGVGHDERYGVPIDYVMVSKDYIVNKYYVHNGIVSNGHLSDHAGVYVELYNSAYEDTDVPVITGVKEGGKYCNSVTVKIEEDHVRSATLNGEEIEYPEQFTLTEAGKYLVEVTDMAGRYAKVSFTLGIHSYPPENWVITQPATCGAKGKKTNECENCGADITQDIPATELHTPAGEGTLVKAPTCGNYGFMSYTCSACGKDYSEVLPKNGNHTAGELIVDVPATCGTAGIGHKDCTVCGEVAQENIEIPATGEHVWATTLTQGDATHYYACTTDGCTARNEEADHTAGEIIVDTAPGCNTTGTGHKDCTACGKTVEEGLTIPATGEHVAADELVVDTAPTCGEPGVGHSVCGTCGITLETGLAIDATGNHAWDNGVITKEPTKTETGVKTFTCTVCGDTKTEKIPATGVDTLTIFKDLKKKDWYVKNGAIDFVYNNGLFSGLTTTEFGPNDNMTRGMFVTVLGRLHGVSVSKKVTTKFTDVKKNQYYTGYVKWASDNDIVAGLTTTTFGPDENVNREQICAMMVRYCNFANITLEKKNAAITFLDAAKISKYARSAVKACQQGGIVNGEKVAGGYNFRPQGNATRAEVATIMMNFAKSYK